MKVLLKNEGGNITQSFEFKEGETWTNVFLDLIMTFRFQKGGKLMVEGGVVVEVPSGPDFMAMDKFTLEFSKD